MSLVNRRDMLLCAAAAAATVGGAIGPLRRVAAQQRLTEAKLLKFEPLGNVTLLHIADLHGQLMPVHLRERSADVGIWKTSGLVSQLSGADILTRFGTPSASPAAHALVADDFAALAREYGR